MSWGKFSSFLIVVILYSGCSSGSNQQAPSSDQQTQEATSSARKGTVSGLVVEDNLNSLFLPPPSNPNIAKSATSPEKGDPFIEIKLLTVDGTETAAMNLSSKNGFSFTAEEGTYLLTAIRQKSRQIMIAATHIHAGNLTEQNVTLETHLEALEILPALLEASKAELKKKEFLEKRKAESNVEDAEPSPEAHRRLLGDDRWATPVQTDFLKRIADGSIDFKNFGELARNLKSGNSDLKALRQIVKRQIKQPSQAGKILTRCWDSDRKSTDPTKQSGKVDIEVKGKGIKVSYSDRCSDTSHLVEMFCHKGIHKEKVIACSCQNNACGTVTRRPVQ